MIENATNEFVDDVVFEHAFAGELVEATFGFVEENVVDVGERVNAIINEINDMM